MRCSFTLLLVLSVSALACGDSTGAGGAGGTDQGGAASGGGGSASEGGGGAGTGGEGTICEPPEGDPDPMAPVVVDTVTALAKDEAGDAISGVTLLFCGADGCLFAETNATGQATFSNTLSSDTMDRPLFKPGDTLVYGQIGYPYTEGGPSPLVGVFPTMEDSELPLVAGEPVSAGGVEVTVPEGGTATVDDLTYDSPEKQTFRAAALPAAEIEAATGDPEFVMVYSLGPGETLFCPTGASVTFDNYADLPADSEVEIFGQDLTLAQHFGGYGKWTKLAEGVVSSDGGTISTVGDGLPVLLTVAIKPK